MFWFAVSCLRLLVGWLVVYTWHVCVPNSGLLCLLVCFVGLHLVCLFDLWWFGTCFDC